MKSPKKLTKKDKEVLKFFCLRVDRIRETQNTSSPAQPIQETEILDILYLLAQKELNRINN